MRDLKEAVLQALAFTMRDFATVRDFEAARTKLRDSLRAALDSDTGETTMRYPKDQNGSSIYPNVRRERGGWGVTVTMGWPFASIVRRYIYETRAQARRADIADAPGRRGRIE